MLGPNGVLSFRGDLKCSYDCDIEAIQIAAKAQPSTQVKKVANLSKQLELEDLETPNKKSGTIKATNETTLKTVDLQMSDPSKMATISAELSQE